MNGNAFEQMKNGFLVELERCMPGLDGSDVACILGALERAAFPYEVQLKEVALTAYVDPVPQLLKVYLAVKKTEGLAAGTLENYKRILTRFFLWVRKQPAEVVSNDIRMFIYEYQLQHGISDRTLDKYREIICWFFSWAHMEEYLQHNPGRAIKPIKHEVRERQPLSQVELEYLRMACETKRERAMLEFMYSTGCRVTELTTVKLDDIDWRKGTVHLFGKGKKHRTSFVNAKCEVALKEYLKTRDDDCEYLFVTQRKPYRKLTKCAVEKVVRLLAERSKVTKHVTPHVLRHTTATTAVNAGMPIEDVSKLLGHSSLNTTLIYAKVATNRVQTEHLRCVV
ncbi:MAG: tyrosine-type recombinase/integrase, partial [Clostridia bacterium]|nr:tyrosine-type recombinase/integrase [Clostridia bacterium]MBQ8557145.1 tyrosine-type recombinase/integrase [Clostridia bacterium]